MFGIGLSGILVIACAKEDNIHSFSNPEPVEPEITSIPKGFPPMQFPEDNEFSIPRWELGKKLFFDPSLSADSKISCASCHAQKDAFADTRKVSIGVDELSGTRNSPSLANIGYHPYFTREGGVPTLEMQVLVPIQEHNEFGSNIVAIAEMIAGDETYKQMSLDAYDREPDAFVITRAIATFERTLISGGSAFDRFVNEGELSALSLEAKRGMDLFFSDRTNCSSCHADFNFTNYSFENNGLYESYEDPGRFRLTMDSADIARFKVPSLRNVALTAPYMHDGSVSSLKEVIHHYNKGGESHLHKSDLIRPLSLSKQEIKDLISFLEALTDPIFITNSNLNHE